ncbi:MAG: nucleoside triphosphate pyrophosphohydrolase family protein [Oscillospiraceae bacterium]|nr:nucleoside triphosphate pyrophosphohydrolase family protein [Oscillospiraceae bacterium]
MTLNEYQELAQRTIRMELTLEGALHHGLYGLAAETGEVLAIFQKQYQGHPVDNEHIKKELGDVLWMIAEICTARRFDLEEVAQLNIEKLKARYPDGFDPDRSMHRREGDV